MLLSKKILITILALGLITNAYAYDPKAKQIATDTASFNKNLSSADTDVQKALETIDEMTAGGGGTTILNDLTDVVVPTPSANNVLMYNGTDWVNVPEGTTFSYSIASFSDGETATQLIGAGVWKAIGAISFTASYNNGATTSAYISKTGWTNLNLTTPFTSVVNTEAVNYPAVASSVTFILHGAKGAETATATESVAFYNYIYWGTSTKEDTYLESDIEGLATSSISNTKGRSFTENPANTYYIIYALPVRLGTVTFWVGGFEGGFQAPETVSVTNSLGFTEDYYVYRSTNEGLGSTTVTVQ